MLQRHSLGGSHGLPFQVSCVVVVAFVGVVYYWSFVVGLLFGVVYYLSCCFGLLLVYCLVLFY